MRKQCLVAFSGIIEKRNRSGRFWFVHYSTRSRFVDALREAPWCVSEEERLANAL